MRYLGIWQEARDFSGRSLANKKLTPLVLSTLGVKGQKILRIVPDFDRHLTTTEIFSNTQICISIPVHFAFFNVIIDIRITMPTAPLSAQIGMKESRQTVAFLVELNLRRKHTTTHGRRSRRLLPELKTV